MAKRPTPTKPPAALPAPVLIAALTAASFDGLRDGFLATIAWPADTADEAKALVVEHVNGFIGHLAANAEAAGLTARTDAEPQPAAAPAPVAGAIEVIVSGPREGRRRLGRGFTEIASSPFYVTADELKQLEADPKLLVQKTGKVAD